MSESIQREENLFFALTRRAVATGTPSSERSVREARLGMAVKFIAVPLAARAPRTAESILVASLRERFTGCDSEPSMSAAARRLLATAGASSEDGVAADAAATAAAAAAEAAAAGAAARAAALFPRVDRLPTEDNGRPVLGAAAAAVDCCWMPLAGFPASAATAATSCVDAPVRLPPAVNAVLTPPAGPLPFLVVVPAHAPESTTALGATVAGPLAPLLRPMPPVPLLRAIEAKRSSPVGGSLLPWPPLPRTLTDFCGGALGAGRDGCEGRGGNGGLREDDAAGVTKLVPAAERAELAEDDTIRLFAGGREDEAKMCVLVFWLTAATGGDPSAEDRLPEGAIGSPEHIVLEGVENGTDANGEPPADDPTGSDKEVELALTVGDADDNETAFTVTAGRESRATEGVAMTAAPAAARGGLVTAEGAPSTTAATAT